MNTHHTPGSRRWHAASGTRAFSLVEVTLALGIMSFALVSLLGLLPVGLNTFHSATDNSVGTQIAQRLVSEAQQTDFARLAAWQQNPPSVRYFDNQGNELPAANKARAVYNTNLAVSTSTTLPGASSNASLATVLVQVVNNPGQKYLATDANNRWVATPGLNISSYAAYVGRNQ